MTKRSENKKRSGSRKDQMQMKIEIRIIILRSVSHNEKIEKGKDDL